MVGIQAHRGQRIRERAHTYGFLKTVARNKFVDRLKNHLRSPTDESLPWEEVVDEDDESTGDRERSQDVQRAVAGLEEKRRRSIIAVYFEGQTLAEAANTTGIPMGSLRRYLREALADLQRTLMPTAMPSSEPSISPSASDARVTKESFDR